MVIAILHSSDLIKRQLNHELSSGIKFTVEDTLYAALALQQNLF